MEKQKRTYIGEVISDRMDKTRLVRVKRIVVVPRYKKRVVRSRNFAFHDEKNKSAVGDRVKIIETRPLSKTKHFRLLEILSKTSANEGKNI